MQVLEILGIQELAYQKALHVSGGQQQRCAIARALVSDTPYILADEPTGALDSTSSREIADILKKISQSGKTILMVTHNADLASTANRIIKLKDGMIYE